MSPGRVLLLCASASVACVTSGCYGGAAQPKPPPSNAPAAAALGFELREPSQVPVQPAPEGLSLLGAEIARAMAELRSQAELKPYFIGQQLTQYAGTRVSATNGALTASNQNKLSLLMTDVRVGDYDLDSTHPLGDDGEGIGAGGSFAMAPLDRGAGDALRRVAWRQIESEYQNASERFLAVKSGARVKVDIEDRSGDFSRETPVQHIGPAASAPPAPVAEWQDRVRALSRRLRDEPGIFSGDASFEAHESTRWIVNSEGTKIQTGELTYRVALSAQTRAEDGMELYRGEQFLASSLEALPSAGELERAAAQVARDLTALRAAKPAEPFVGPAILLGRAAGVFFHETFGHRVEGERQKFEDEGQTFAKKVGERIMPGFLNVYDDPRLFKFGRIDLGGFYLFDDQGVVAQRASLVEAGVLKGFLLSRVPVRGFAKSNGHGRRLSGSATARQANLVIEASRTVEPSELRRQLIAEVKRQRKPYGLTFAEIEGGYTETVRESTQGYKLMPVMVYRVFTDGRPDELIRGVDIVGTPLTSLSKVLAAANDYAVFNGSCGAESGWVPVSAISPSLLLQQIEVALRDKGNDRPPTLPAPAARPIAKQQLNGALGAQQ